MVTHIPTLQHRIRSLSSIDILVIVDNEIDPISRHPEEVHAIGNLVHIALQRGRTLHDRGIGAVPPEGNEPTPVKEVSMHSICCGGHGLSLMVTAFDNQQNKHRSVLFDAGPEEDLFEANIKKLQVDLSSVEVIVISHWHRDHTGGLLRAVKLVNEARLSKGLTAPVAVDVHPDRPSYRGFQTPVGLFSLEADPTFEEIKAAGGSLTPQGSVHSLLSCMFAVTGYIPRSTGYEVGLRAGRRFIQSSKSWIVDEEIRDERCLVCTLDGSGSVVFTGCGHAGVVNTTRHVGSDLFPSLPVYAVMGGFHLADADPEKLQNTISGLKEWDPNFLIPGHCTGWRAVMELEKGFPARVAPSRVGYKFTLKAKESEVRKRRLKRKKRRLLKIL